MTVYVCVSDLIFPTFTYDQVFTTILLHVHAVTKKINIIRVVDQLHNNVPLHRVDSLHQRMGLIHY